MPLDLVGDRGSVELDGSLADVLMREVRADVLMREVRERGEGSCRLTTTDGLSEVVLTLRRPRRARVQWRIPL